MSKRNDFIWNAIRVVCWIVFAGFCVQTGALLFNYIYSLFRPVATHNLHLGLDLSKIYAQSQAAYTALFSLVIALSALKAYVFFLVIRIFYKLNLVRPFSEEVSRLISSISYYAFSIGLVSYIAHRFTRELVKRGYEVDVVERYWNDSGAFLMMAGILFVIALIFRKGIEMQSENELTV